MEGVKRIKGSKGKEERAELSITLGEKFEAVLFCGVATRNKGFEASWLKNTQAVIKLKRPNSSKGWLDYRRRSAEMLIGTIDTAESETQDHSTKAHGKG